MGTPIPATPPVDDCEYCTVTPLRLKLTVTNMNGSGCSCCQYVVAPSPERWRKVILTGLDGVYILTQDPVQACFYDENYAGNFGTIEIHDNNTCSSLIATWTIKALWVHVSLFETFAWVTIWIYAYDNATLKLLGQVCHGQEFDYKAGEDCGVWDAENFSQACFSTPPLCHSVYHLASGGTIQCERI